MSTPPPAIDYSEIRDYLDDSPSSYLTELLVDYKVVKNESVVYEWSSPEKVDELMDFFESNPKSSIEFLNS